MKARLNRMVQEVKEHQRKEEVDLLSMYIEMRLNKQLSNYYKDLVGSYNTLSGLNERKVMKKLVK